MRQTKYKVKSVVSEVSGRRHWYVSTVSPIWNVTVHMYRANTWESAMDYIATIEHMKALRNTLSIRPIERVASHDTQQDRACSFSCPTHDARADPALGSDRNGA